MPLSGFDLSVWAASFIGHLLLLVVLLARKREQQFPVFTALIAFNVLRSCLLFYVNSRHHRQYFNTYWILAAMDEVLEFAFLYESASIVFRPSGAWARDIRGALWLTLAVCVSVAVVLTITASPVIQNPIQAVILRGKFLAATLMTELFVGMMALSARVGLAWKTHVARICQGLGLYSGFCVIADTSVTYYGIRPQSHLYEDLSHARIFIYLLCLGYWIVALWLKAPDSRRMPEVMHGQVLLLQQKLEADMGRLRSWK